MNKYWKLIWFWRIQINIHTFLSNYLAKKQKISYEKALRQIEKEVKEWKKKLKTQALFIGNLGKLSLNQNKKIHYNLQNPRKLDYNLIKMIKNKEYVKKISV